MKRLFLLSFAIGVTLIVSSLFFSGSTDASPALQATVTPQVIHLPLVCKNWSPSESSFCKMYGINFSPYIDNDEDPNKGGVQITDEELQERMEIIAPYTEWIRTFGCNEDLKEAGEFAHAMGLKAAVGAWLGDEPEAEQENQNQIDCLIDQARQGHVDIAIVGSEVLLRDDLSEDKLIDYINEVKQYFQEEGIDVPVTYADVYSELLNHPNVISAVDLVFVNYYPYWEGSKIDYAINRVHNWHQQMIDTADGKEVIVSETGWPSCGDQIGDAVPSLENARFYLLSFASWARGNNVKYFYFEAFDEKWKARYEGPQGACWGMWDREGNLKPGMERVFDCNLPPPTPPPSPPSPPVIDFFALPQRTETNIQTFAVASSTELGNEILLNNTPLPSNAMDEAGNFAAVVPLHDGDNPLELVIKSDGEIITTTEKVVHFDDDFTTGGKRLIYVDSVALGEGVPALPGTIVIDLDNDTLLGLIEEKHVVGISPDGSEIYTSDRTVISTDTHRELRTLLFTQDIPSNGFIVSPDSNRLYSKDERLDAPANTLLDNLPIDITTGRYSWCGAPRPGGPAISANGQTIYCIAINNIKTVDTEDNIATNTNITITNAYVGDIALSPDEGKILISDYSYGAGRLRVYDANTFESLGMISGLGDFVGEIAFSKDGQRVIVGSAGNPASATNGRITVIDLDKLESIFQTTVPLADNLVTSGNNEFFVSSGSRLGIDVYVLEPSGNLVRTKSFFLGINRFIQDTCNPKHDQIRKIVFKP